jgi:predicted heme/steroid binding protein
MSRPQHVPAGESVKVNGRKWDGPLLVARNAVLRELSLLPMGADGNTDAGFSAGAITDVAMAAVTQGG